LQNGIIALLTIPSPEASPLPLLSSHLS